MLLCRGSTPARTKYHSAAHLLPSPQQWDGKKNWKKVKPVGYEQFKNWNKVKLNINTTRCNEKEDNKEKKK